MLLLGSPLPQPCKVSFGSHYLDNTKGIWSTTIGKPFQRKRGATEAGITAMGGTNPPSRSNSFLQLLPPWNSNRLFSSSVGYLAVGSPRLPRHWRQQCHTRCVIFAFIFMLFVADLSQISRADLTLSFLFIQKVRQNQSRRTWQSQKVREKSSCGTCGKQMSCH